MAFTSRDDTAIEDLLARAGDRIGDVLQHHGARLAQGATPERGRSTCPVHGGKNLNMTYSNGLACCHSKCGGEGWDAIGIIRAIENAGFREAVTRLAEILAEADPVTDRTQPIHRPAPRVTRPVPTPTGPTPEELWDKMAVRDPLGEDYLQKRGLFVSPLPSEVVRFNIGNTTSSFVNMAARRGFRIAFAVRNARGEIVSISFRHLGDGADWNGEVLKKISLPACSTRGVAIVRPEVTFLTQNDPEFVRDEVILCEGGTDWLAVTISNDAGFAERRVPPAWVLGSVGASNAATMVKAFGVAIAGRVVRIWLDTDEAGQKAADAAAGAALEVGARAVRRYTPSTKDVASTLASAE